MTIIERITAFFRKDKKQPQIQEVINLNKWNRLKKLPDSYLNDLLRETSLEDIAIALVHEDRRMIDRFISKGEPYLRKRRNTLEKLLETTKTTKVKSDRMKAHLANLSGLDKPGYLQYKPYDLI